MSSRQIIILNKAVNKRRINDNKRNENIIGKITNRALVINSSNFNLLKVERIKHIKYKIKTKGRG